MQGEQLLRFGPYRLDLGTEQLWRGTLEVSLTPKALAVLRVLVARPGQVVTKDEFFQSVWSETVVSDDALAACIQELRRALRDDARKPRYIETMHRRGYRFLPTVTAQPVPSAEFRVPSWEEEGRSREEVASSQYSSVVSSQEEEKQEAKGENGLASSVQSLESEDQTSSPPLMQTPDIQPPLPIPPARRFWLRSSLVLFGLLLFIGGSIVAHYLSLSTPSTQPLTPNTQDLPLPDKPSIAVMPFTNLSGDPAQEYFSDGLTDDLITDLSRLSALFVIARHSVFTYKGKAVKVQDVSKELGVRYVLEGSVRRTDGQVRINAQLVDATTGHHLWAERYDRELRGIFALQDEIVQQIVVNLNTEVRQAELERVRRTPTNNLTAYDHFLRGTELYQRFTKETNAQARQMFEKALELDPTYALAYMALGWTYHHEWVWQWSQDSQTLEQCFALAQKALVLDDSLPQAHSLLGQAYVLKRQHEQAIVESERAIVLNPSDARGYYWLAETLSFSGKPEEAIGAAEKAMRLDPRNRDVYLLEVGKAYSWMGRYEEAITTLKRVLTHAPYFLGAHLNLVVSYSELGREAEARAEVAEVLRLSPNFSLESLRQRFPYKDQARFERQLAALRKAGLK